MILPAALSLKPLSTAVIIAQFFSMGWCNRELYDALIDHERKHLGKAMNCSTGSRFKLALHNKTTKYI